MAMELKIQTTKTFENAYNCEKKIQLHQGSARSGKSFAIIQYLIVMALESKQLISIVRKTFPALRTSALRDFKDIMGDMQIWHDDYWMSTEHTYRFPNGSVIEFFSTDTAEKLKGLRRDILWIDEANELSYEQYFQLAIRTTGNIIVSYNPSFSPKHWLLSEVADGNDADVLNAIQQGYNIATVFGIKKTLPMPESYLGRPVFNGDESDLRFLDPKGVVVGLYAKGKAKKDTSGFVKYPTIMLQAA